MSFDAGAIVGSLKLDLSDYAHGILQAQAVSAVFPSIVTEFLEQPLLGAIQVAKEAAAAIGEAIGSTAEKFHAVGLAAERAGVDVQWLSQLSGVAQTVGVGMDQLVTGFKTLEQRAELAAEGNQEAAKGFERLGISAQEAASLMATPQQLFERVHESIDAITNPSERTAAALGVLGRQGFNLAPLLTKSQQEIGGFGNLLAELGGTVNESEAQMGAAWGKMEAVFDATWNGIKKAIAEPILEALTGHMDEIVGYVRTASSQIREVIGSIVPTVVAAIPKFIEFGSSFLSGIVEVMKTFAPVAQSTFALFTSLAEVVGSVLVPVFQILKPLLDGVAVTLSLIHDVIGGVLTGIAEVMHGVSDAIGLTSPDGRQTSASANRAGGAGTYIQSVSVTVPPVDVNEASTQMVAKMRPALIEGLARQKRQLQTMRDAGLVEESL